MSFLRPRKVEKNYDLFSGCAWYTPGVAGVFAVLGWFLAGMILGSLINIGLMIFLPGFPLYYSMLIVYPVQFIPVLMYVRLRSMRNSTFDRLFCRIIELIVILCGLLCCVHFTQRAST